MPTITAIIAGAIAMIAVYTSFALVVSWLQEQLAALVSLRAKTLILGIRQLIGDDDGAFSKVLISTVGEPFTVRSIAAALPAAGGAGTAKAPNALASVTGVAYVAKFFGAKLPAAGNARFPSYIASRDFVSNLMTYVTDSWLLQAAAKVLLEVQALPDDTRKRLPPLIVAASDAEELLQAVRAGAAALYQLEQGGFSDAILSDLKKLSTTSDLTAPFAQTAAELEAAISAMPQPLRDIMLARFRDAGAKYDSFVAKLEQWYDDYMDRVSGWYKRCATLVTIYLSVIVVVVLNLDSADLARSFAANPALTQALGVFSNALVQANQQLVQQQVQSGASPAPNATPAPAVAIVTSITCPAPAGTAAPATASSAGGSSSAGAPPCPSCPTGFVAGANGACVVDVTPLQALPLGYPDRMYHSTALALGGCGVAAPACTPAWYGYAGAGALKLLGWAASIIALSLGAPFWFDLLATFVSVRAGGSPPQTSAQIRRQTVS